MITWDEMIPQVDCNEPFTPQQQHAYSQYCSSYISLSANLFIKQDFLWLVINSIILVVLLCNSWVKL